MWGARSYVGVVEAKPGRWLLGGVREIRSSRFPFKEQAERWRAVVVELNGEDVRSSRVEASKKRPEIPITDGW